MKLNNCLRTIAFLGITVVASGAAAREMREHPRRTEVNRRIRNQERRIDKGVKDGTISADEAKKLKGELAGVKAEERAEVKANGGSLTKPEQKQLNQELNEDSKQIYKERHD